VGLTAFQIENAGTGKPKALGAGKHHDEDGLYLEVRSATSKSWSSRLTLKGKEIWRGIGPVKDIPLKRARELHVENRRMVAEGSDPKEYRKALHAAAAIEAAKTVTFEEAAGRFIASHEDGWRNAKHRRDWRNSLATYAYPIIGNTPLQLLDTDAAERLLKQPADETTFWLARPETARRVRGRCEQIWAAAKAKKLCCGDNPFDWSVLKHQLPKHQRRSKRVKHHRAVPWKEIPSVAAALRARSSVSARCLEFTLLTVPRTSEVINAQWSECDLANAVWEIPGERMKGGFEHRIPLCDRAVKIIKEQLPEKPKPDALVWDHLSDAALTKMLRLIGRPETVHGLRSSFRDWVAEGTNFQRELAEKALAHTIGDETERAYQRGDLFEKRRKLMAAWARYCAGETVPVDMAV
jgi:integrase